jgi:hypothetical protein
LTIFESQSPRGRGGHAVFFHQKPKQIENWHNIRAQVLGFMEWNIQDPFNRELESNTGGASDIH